MSDVGGAGVGGQSVAHGQVADVVQGGADLFVLADQRLDAARDRLGIRRFGSRAGPARGFGSLDGREDDCFLLLEVGHQLGRHLVERGHDLGELGVLVAVHVRDLAGVGGGLGDVRLHVGVVDGLDVVDEARQGPVPVVRVLAARASSSPPRARVPERTGRCRVRRRRRRGSRPRRSRSRCRASRRPRPCGSRRRRCRRPRSSRGRGLSSRTLSPRWWREGSPLTIPGGSGAAILTMVNVRAQAVGRTPAHRVLR